MNQLNMPTKIGIGCGVLLLVCIIIVVTGGMPFAQVPKGSTGVKIRFGAVVGEAIKPGLCWKTPFIETIRMVNTQQDNAQEASDADSKDLQKIHTEVKVLYALTPSLVPSAYDRIGGREEIEERLISPAIRECFKAVTSKYTAEELITKRHEVSQSINENLRTFIERSEESENLVGLIRFDNIAVESFSFSPEFNNAIEAKVIAEQTALRAQQEKLQKITEAEARKEEVRLASEAKALQITNEAQAEAEQITLTSTARAEAIKREAAALAENPNLIELRAVETWDGKLPTFSGGGAIPFLNIPMSSERQ